ncbi:MAG: hypothetical protein KKH28_10060 [Elusimicrobia bacterium]|nr:hypothetical protein [Elusimicrobiota bacterium]
MKFNNLAVLAAVLFASGCAAFRSGDARVSRNDFRTMLSDKTVAPFADIRVTWKNFPYKSPIDTIGEGSVLNPPKQRAVPVPAGDLDRFRTHAKSVLADAGLYNAEKGSGTLELEMTSINRWTYKELLRGFMVDTPFIFIVPASFKTGYRLAAAFETPSGAAKVEETGQRKTVFHLLLVPLYPFFSPGAKESGLINNMLWKTATDIYGKLKLQAPASGAVPEAVQESAPAAQPAPPPAVSPRPDAPVTNPAEEAVETDD